MSYYSEIANTIKNQEGATVISPQAVLDIDVYDANAITHQQAASRLTEKGIIANPAALDKPSQVEVGLNEYSILGRHTVDYKNKEIQMIIMNMRKSFIKTR